MNKEGQLGLGDLVQRGANVPIPFLVKTFSNDRIVAVSCGDSHTAVITENKDLYTFGNNDRGQLGLGSSVNKDIPTMVRPISYQGVITVSCGSRHTAIITKNNQLHTFGSNDQGQLGLGQLKLIPGFRSNIEAPTIAENFCGPKALIVSCGDSHTAVTAVIKNNKQKF